MYIKAVQRAEAIGGFGGDELVIGMGDMVKKHRKTSVVSWLYSFKVVPPPVLGISQFCQSPTLRSYSFFSENISA